MDTVFVKGLKLSATIGCLAWERQIKQALLLSFELQSDHHHTNKTDQIADALDYALICERITAFVEKSECRLIETLAEQIAQLLQDEFAVSHLSLTLEKPGALAQAATVGVTLQRSK
jgi:7,8-dihydroneopterin aldolase/epimerase/oxygenase